MPEQIPDISANVWFKLHYALLREYMRDDLSLARVFMAVPGVKYPSSD